MKLPRVGRSSMKLVGACFATCLLRVASWQTRWFQQPIDHSGNVGTFRQRYLVQDDFGEARRDGPLLFFCGNEGDVAAFANFSGFLREAAVALDGQVVFAEHRFYGQSLPFGPDFSKKQAQYLTVEQALEDYAQLIRSLVADAQRSVVVFGGSYGGMLSSWMRARRGHDSADISCGGLCLEDVFGYVTDISGRSIMMINRDSEKVSGAGFCGGLSEAFSDLLPSVRY
eukprot:s3567_g11.t1